MMTNIRLSVLLLLAMACGCDSTQSTVQVKSETISALTSRHRNATAIALWTLEQNKFTVPQINFEKPYSEEHPKLGTLVKALEQLPQAKLTELDESFKYHRSIYSPASWPGGEGWTDK